MGTVKDVYMQYLSLGSLPGGPSISSVCIHAGWTMGTVKDVYMQYLSLGDQFVGHCLAMLPLLQMELASSPPPFRSSVE